MILVLAEKPSVGKEIAKVLNCRKNGSGFISGEKYIVTWALGHLVTLADPEKYDDKYKTWSLDTLPMLPEKFKLEVIKSTSKQFSTVKKLLRSPDVSSIIIATDAGREGELVARWIIEKSGVHKPVKRLWISSQTDRAVRQGFNSLKDGAEYDNLYMAAQARAEADWLVGLNVTRALTCKFNAQLSAGRVQTPTLALIVEREEKIKQFVPKEYYTIHADLGDITALLSSKNTIFDRNEAEKIAALLKGKSFLIKSVKRTAKEINPPMLYDLTELQRDANKLYGYSPKQTLNIMQKLYEQHKALTYPRTDSRYLTDDIVPTLNDRLKAINNPAAADILKNKYKINKACVNGSKVSDHHAIIPTEQRVPMISLTSEEKNIYGLVINRFMACFMPSYKYIHIKAEFECGDYLFTAGGKEETELGWRSLENLISDEEISEDEVKMPKLLEGSNLACRGIKIKASKTKAPVRYTEASLLSAMENPSRFVDDKKMKEYLGGGLGTPATRADIIEKLYSSFYVEKQGSSMVPTSKGIQLIKLVPPDLKEPLLTAKWERELERIAAGKADKNKFIDDIREYSKNLVKTVKQSEAVYKHDNLTRKPCPECGRLLLEVNGKKGKMLVCQDRDCGFRQTLSITTNARCPECHKKMELRGEGEKKSFYCSCGYREKYSAFKERKAQRGASKRDVKNYLRKQNKNDETNNPFAAAFDKLNL